MGETAQPGDLAFNPKLPKIGVRVVQRRGNPLLDLYQIKNVDPSPATI